MLIAVHDGLAALSIGRQSPAAGVTRAPQSTDVRRTIHGMMLAVQRGLVLLGIKKSWSPAARVM